MALEYGADVSPLPTLLLFGPRWVMALPLVVLVPLAVYARSWWAAAITLVAGVIVAGPICGGTVSVGSIFASDRPALAQIRVVSWNMAGSKRGPEFRRFLAETEATFLVCQESNLTADELPKGWKVYGTGGNRIATQLTLRNEGSHSFLKMGVGGHVQRYSVETPDGEMKLINIHLPTVRPGIETAVGTKFRDLDELRRIIEIRTEASRIVRDWIGDASWNTLVVGDFNMPVESRIYRDDWSGFRNAYSEAGNGWGTTKQTSWYGTRIDHVLYSQPWRCRKAWVGPAMGSDHRPVIAELEWVE